VKQRRPNGLLVQCRLQLTQCQWNAQPWDVLHKSFVDIFFSFLTSIDLDTRKMKQDNIQTIISGYLTEFVEKDKRELYFLAPTISRWKFQRMNMAKPSSPPLLKATKHTWGVWARAIVCQVVVLWINIHSGGRSICSVLCWMCPFWITGSCFHVKATRFVSELSASTW